MKKTLILFTLSLLFVATAWAQGLETFDNLGITGTSYQTGDFLGQDGSTWEFTQCRGDVDINGKSIMIGRNRNPQSFFESGTISGGIGTLKFKYMQAFANNVNLNVLVNDVVVANVTSSNELEKVLNSGDITVNVGGDFVIKFINAVNGAGQVCVDDVEWTAYGGAPTPFISVTGSLANFTYEFDDGPSSAQSFKVTGDNLIGNINISAPDNYEISLVSGESFSSSIELPENNAVVENTDIYVRLKAGLAVGTYNGEIIEISSDDADSKTVTCNGEVTAPVYEPEDLIHYWNFNKDIPATSTNWDQPIEATIGTGELTYEFSEAYSYAGTTINGIDNEVNGGSFSPQGGEENENNEKYFDLIAPTTGYENIVLSYATRGTATGFKTQAIWYSTDGGDSFTFFETIDGRNVSSWSIQTIDFSSVVGANNNSNFVIRIVLDGANYSGGTQGNNRFDNIRIMGDDLGGGDPPVPVELSSFTATISALNYVTLTWVTQTETGMRGYYVFRAPANDLASAQIVSPMIESMNSSQQQSYIYEDRELYDSGTYYYWLQANDLDGSSAFHGPVSVVYNSMGEHSTPEIPLVTQLHSVYPNPFNPTVFIPFSLAHDGAVSFKIYNSRGQMVKHFDLGTKSAGQHRISWDGTDYNGKSLANGVYHIMMSTQDQVYKTKAALLK